jgi:cephalosporin-C deacetylase-like acetyl esterase
MAQQKKVRTMTTESQNNAILRYMQQGKELTALEALKLFNCMRLAARINDIKEMGIDIADRWITRDDGKRFKAYRVK